MSRLPIIALAHGSGIETQPGLTPRPSLESSRVALEAAKLLGVRVVSRIVVSGKGPTDEAVPATEARLMADLLVSEGVPHGDIEVEDQSTSTLGNWVQSLDYFDPDEFDGIWGISRRLQTPRANLTGRFVLAQSGIEGIGIVTYSGVPEETLRKSALDIGREAASAALFLKFRRDNPDIKPDQMIESYEAAKDEFGFNSIKRRGSR